MVPHTFVCANSKSAEFANSSDFPFQGGQTAANSVRHNRIHRPQLIVLQRHQLQFCTDYPQAARTLRYRRWRCQTPPSSAVGPANPSDQIRQCGHYRERDIANRHTFRRESARSEKGGQAISLAPEATGVNLCSARVRPTFLPGKLSRLIQAPQFRSLHLTASLLQRPKCKQPSCPDGCLNAVLDQDAVVCSITTGNLS